VAVRDGDGPGARGGCGLASRIAVVTAICSCRAQPLGLVPPLLGLDRQLKSGYFRYLSALRTVLLESPRCRAIAHPDANDCRRSALYDRLSQSLSKGLTPETRMSASRFAR
jgi:hypothetical protein